MKTSLNRGNLSVETYGNPELRRKEEYMNSKRLGNIGEAKVLSSLVELGIPTYLQFGDNEPADYIIIVDNNCLKVQVKTSSTYNGEKTDFDLTSSTIHRKNGIKHKYTKIEVDLFLCYDEKTKQIFVIKNEGNMSGISIRYKQPLNNQISNVRMYSDFLLSVETLQEVSKANGYDKEKVQTTIGN